MSARTEWLLTAAVVGAGLYLIYMSAVRAAPPEGADPALAPYYSQLYTHSGGSCCSMADCRPADWRIVGGHYEALSPEGWVVVPEEAVLTPRDVPDGRGTLCWTHARGVLCFVPGTGT